MQYEFQEIKAAIEFDRNVAANVGWKSLVTNAGNRRRMRIIVAIAFFSQWSGNGLASYYLNVILDDIGITDPDTQVCRQPRLKGNANDNSASHQRNLANMEFLTRADRLRPGRQSWAARPLYNIGSGYVCFLLSTDYLLRCLQREGIFECRQRRRCIYLPLLCLLRHCIYATHRLLHRRNLALPNSCQGLHGFQLYDIFGSYLQPIRQSNCSRLVVLLLISKFRLILFHSGDWMEILHRIRVLACIRSGFPLHLCR